MSGTVISELNHDDLRAKLNRYTRKAFIMLPQLDKPRILDIGCGSGVPTLELARLSDGEVVGIDIDSLALDRFKGKIEKIKPAARVKIKKCSLFHIDFSDEAFDIVWSEGAIQFIGFEQGLKEWRRLIKPQGFLVVHDEIGGTDEKIMIIPTCGYRLINHFIISGDIWSEEFYNPYEMRIKKLMMKYRNNPEALAILDEEQSGVDKFRNNPKSYGSVFFIMQKSIKSSV